ncbi:MAG: hypothetical protein PHV59_01765 [Victivallales bacterium]|nr:hypothetical protein [Victivallales bacterium]
MSTQTRSRKPSVAASCGKSPAKVENQPSVMTKAELKWELEMFKEAFEQFLPAVEYFLAQEVDHD